MHFHILGPQRARMLVQSAFFWYSRILEILSPQFDSIDFNFSSDHSDLIFILLNLGFNFSSDRSDLIFILLNLGFNFSSDRSDPIFLLLNLGSIQYLAIYCSTSYFWCVIFRFRSRGGRMITSLNWISTHLNLIAWGIWFPSYVLVTWGISSLGASCSPSFWHLCHLLHLMIIWSHLITFLIWVCWTGIGTV